MRGPSEAEVRDIRARLSEVRGREYWARLESLAGTPGFQAFLRRWFPSQAPAFEAGLPRREFLRRMGASLAVAGLGACTRQPDEVIVPYGSSPEASIPGKPRYFATTLATGAGAMGVLVESHMGRPTKVEGNPGHPASLGATDGIAQAAVLGLYDPDRSHSVLEAGQISTWDAFLTELRSQLDGLEASGGAGLAVLVADVSSPTLRADLAGLRERFPNLRLHHWTPLHRDASRRAARASFGRDVVPRYAFDRADVVLSLDADFLAAGPGGVRYAHDFAARRRVRAGGRDEAASMNRLYAVESSVTLTGAMADHRLALRPSQVGAFARLLASELGLTAAASVSGAAPELRAFARAVAKDLSALTKAGASSSRASTPTHRRTPSRTP